MRQRSPPIDSLSPQRVLPRILLAILFFPIGTIMVLAGISTKATALTFAATAFGLVVLLIIIGVAVDTPETIADIEAVVIPIVTMIPTSTPVPPTSTAVGYQMSPEAWALREYYIMLLEFKDDPVFHHYCYGQGGYNEWATAVNALSDHMLFVETGINPIELRFLGREYCQNSGRDNERTREIIGRINPNWLYAEESSVPLLAGQKLVLTTDFRCTSLESYHNFMDAMIKQDWDNHDAVMNSSDCQRVHANTPVTGPLNSDATTGWNLELYELLDGTQLWFFKESVE